MIGFGFGFGFSPHGALLKQKITHSWVTETVERYATRNTAFAGTVRYIAPTGNDANSGLTAELAKKTVTAAYNASANGDIIQFLDGTYNVADESGGYALINLTGKGVLMRGNSANKSAVVLSLTTTGSYLMRTRDCGELRFENMTFSTNQNAQLTQMSGAYNSNFIKFYNCDFLHTGAGTGSYFFSLASSVITNEVTRHIEFNTCKFVGIGEMSAQPIALNNAGINTSVLLLNCEFEMTARSAFFSGDATRAKFHLYGNKITMKGDVLAVSFGTDTGIPANTITLVDFRGNEITFEGAYSQHGILMGRGTNAVICQNNKVIMPGINNAAAIGLVFKTVSTNVGDSVFEGNYVVAPRPFYIKGGKNGTFEHNSFISNEEHFEAFGFTNYKLSADEVLSQGNVVKNNNLVANTYGIATYNTVDESQEVMDTLKSCDINNNKYYLPNKYALNGDTAAEYLFDERADFWGASTNDDESILITAIQLPIELPV